MTRSIFAFLALTLVVSTQAHATKRATATLKVPVYIEQADGSVVPVAQLNADLKKAGVAELPIFMEVGNDEKNAYKKIEAFDKTVDAAIAKAGPEWVDSSRNNPLFPTEGETSDVGTCYTGDAVAVPDAVSAFAGVVYTEQLNMFAMKYKTYVRYFDSSDNAQTDSFLSAESPLWKNWKSTDESILILAAVGDGGDDVNEALIPICK